MPKDTIGNKDDHVSRKDNNSGEKSKNKQKHNDPLSTEQFMLNVADFQEKFLENMSSMMSGEMPSSIFNVNAPEATSTSNNGWDLPWLEMDASSDNKSFLQSMQDNSKAMQQFFDIWSNIYTSGQEGWNAASQPRRDKRFQHDAWASHPVYAALKQSYYFITDQTYAWLDQQTDMDDREKERLKFQLDQMFDAGAPNNFAISNPEIMEKAIQTKGESLKKGMENLAYDMKKGQLTHTDPDAFELGVNIAMTPGKVVHETELYQLIQYEPMTKDQLAIPVVIFPPWINRYYILDLNPEKSFVKWALEQGISIFIVSWKSADSSMADIIWDDYVKAEIDAIDTIREGLDVPSVHTIGYCVAGTTLNAALALMHARGEEAKVKSATFFTTQVDFEDGGDLKAFTTDAHIKMLEAISSQGYLDGRVMAATFNMLRSKDLIWNYVVNNYLLGNDYPAFDLLHWNGDTTNLPAAWHNSYITDLYRDNLLVEKNRLSVDGTPIDLTLIKTPSYIQAGIEDHIAPAKSVWKLRNHLSGPKRFTLAGSGHIAGVVNHPAAQKYQYWRNDAEDLKSLDDFIAGATETKGSWWPDWVEWLEEQDSERVSARGARIPGKGELKVIEDAPGRYVRMR